MWRRVKSILKWLGFIKGYHTILHFLSVLKRGATCFKYYLYNSWFTNFPNYAVRTFYLRRIIGIKIGRNTAIQMGCFFHGRQIIIGNNTVVAKGCYIDGRVGLITIKNNVSISPEAYILSLTHLVNSPVFESAEKNVVIEDYAWIGARAMVMPGVKMGTGSVLGAGSVATRDIPDYSVFAGSPAKEVARRTDNLQYTLNYFPPFN